MVKNFKRLLLFAAMLLVVGAGSVYAAQTGNVYDDADLLTEGEASALDETIAALMEESGWNIYAVTTSDAQGKTATAYADDFFDEYSTDQENGVVLLIDMDNREITISTGGEAIRYLTDARIDRILDDAYQDISNGDYGACLLAMADGVQDSYDTGIEEGQYNYDTQTGEVSRYYELTGAEAAMAAVAAAVLGCIIYLSVTGHYRMRYGAYQYGFRENARVTLRVSDDRFVNQTVTHRRIPKQTTSGSTGNSSGASSTHTSSSGQPHGGGSRKF